jgi:predicted nucleotidyltransferase
MRGKTGMQRVMNTFTNECKALFGDKLLDVLLYGSYARGDFNEDSDIDVMVILDMDDSEARKYLGKICEIAFEAEAGAEYDMLISPVIQSKYAFDKYKELPGFQNNVMREGVSMVVG